LAGSTYYLAYGEGEGGASQIFCTPRHGSSGLAITARSGINVRVGGDDDDLVAFGCSEEFPTFDALHVLGGVSSVQLTVEYNSALAASSTLVPAWSTEDETAYKTALNGAALADREQKMHELRQCYPDVFRAYRLVRKDDDETAYAALVTKLSGISGTLGVSNVPWIRQALDRLYSDKNGIEYPLRVQLYQDSSWKDVKSTGGLESDGSGRIFFNGFTDERNGDLNVYMGSLIDAPNDVTHRRVKLTLRVPIDDRINDNAQGEEVLDTGWTPACKLVRNNAWVRIDSVNADVSTAYPDVNETLVDDSSALSAWTSTAPADEHCRTRRSHRWVLLGINELYFAGNWLESVDVRGTAGALIVSLDLNGLVIAETTLDFQKQITVVGLED
jgi:hypothetical protein